MLIASSIPYGALVRFDYTATPKVLVFSDILLPLLAMYLPAMLFTSCFSAVSPIYTVTTAIIVTMTASQRCPNVSL